MPVPSGRNPTRRNRNIGTARSGHGQDNEMVIPESWWDDRVFWEKLTGHTTVTRQVHGRDFDVIVEHTRKDCIHPCTVDDVFHVLAQVPNADLDGIDCLVMRQPKKKEQILSPVWGRMQFETDFGRHERPAVILESCNLSTAIHWKRSLDGEAARRLERLRQAGHRVTSTRREYVIELSLESARNTMLYGTLLHEVGHWVDWCRIVLKPSQCDDTTVHDLERQYFARAVSEREDVAWRYADAVAVRLRKEGILPFDRKLDPESLASDGLRIEDFLEPPSGR